MGYEKDTRSAYRNRFRAKEYKRHHTEDFSWARLAMWRECLCVERVLKLCGLNRNSRILDIPCGTGILADGLSRIAAGIVAADISLEMIELAQEEYRQENFRGFIQCDITRPSFKMREFDCAIILGFLHRVPLEIKKATLKEISSISKRFIIVSCSIDSGPQRFKQWIIRKIRKSHKPAPEPVLLREMLSVFKSADLIVKKSTRVLPFLSAEVVFLLEKKVRLFFDKVNE